MDVVAVIHDPAVIVVDGQGSRKQRDQSLTGHITVTRRVGKIAPLPFRHIPKIEILSTRRLTTATQVKRKHDQRQVERPNEERWPRHMDNLSRVERHSHGNVLGPESPCARVTPQRVWQTVGGDPPLVELSTCNMYRSKSLYASPCSGASSHSVSS